MSISGIKYLQVGQIKPHLGTFYQSLWALILSCSQLSAGLASLLLVLWGAGPFPNPGEKGKSAVSVQGTLQCLASAASRTQFPASPLSRHQRWAWSLNCKSRTGLGQRCLKSLQIKVASSGQLGYCGRSHTQIFSTARTNFQAQYGRAQKTGSKKKAVIFDFEFGEASVGI